MSRDDRDIPADLTRWNRAGLRRFHYVDGNAAVWLDYLRRAMLTRFVDGREAGGESPKWEALLGDERIGDTPGPAVRRRQILDAYAARSDDMAAEILRATARAAHVLIGHVDAFANEGYLRTATQWESMRKLVAMIGYHPTPGAAASTIVSLIVDTAAEVERGVAMSFTPPGGGKPLVFETIDAVEAHPALNAARAVGHDRNETLLQPGSATPFILPKGAAPRPGDLAVIVDTARHTGTATYIEDVLDLDAEAGWARLKPLPPDGPFTAPALADTLLMTRPEQVKRPIPTSSGYSLVYQSQLPLQVGDVLFVRLQSGIDWATPVKAVDGLRFEIELSEDLGDEVEFRLAERFQVGRQNDIFDAHGLVGSGPVAVTHPGVDQVAYLLDGTMQLTEPAWSLNDLGSWISVDKPEPTNEDRVRKSLMFPVPSGAGKLAFARSDVKVMARQVPPPPPIFTSQRADEGDRKVEFAGKPLASLGAGSWFVARPAGSGALAALEVKSVRTGPETHIVEFHTAIPFSGSTVEYHGPMALALRPEHHDRGPNPVAARGGVQLAPLPDGVSRLVKAGSSIIIEDERRSRAPVLMTIAAIEDVGTSLRLTSIEGYETQSDGPLVGFLSGWTVLRLNTARATHGETRASKVLGSGNAELPRQTFNFPVKDITFVPSSASETGIVPDMDVAVQNVIWTYRDLSDPDAEDTDAWSYLLREDDTLDIVFRRRLPTGLNNVVVRRHRSGTGPTGNDLPRDGVDKPARRMRVVTGIAQPFGAAGGSAREPVSAMRESAPSRLVANGRAVSSSDFPRLLSRHASVQEGRTIGVPTASGEVRLVVVPASGMTVSDGLRRLLEDYVRDRAAPGIRPVITGFDPVEVTVSATLRIDTRRYDRDDVLVATDALLRDRFSVRRRRLGQSLTVGEVLAAIEEVEGVENASATLYPSSGQGWRRTAYRSRSYRGDRQSQPRAASNDGKVPAGIDQVAFVALTELVVEVVA